MSARMDLHGRNAPPHTLEHNGKTYTIPRALALYDLLVVEDALYQRALKSLYAQKEFMDAGAYAAELKALREQSTNGEFALEHPATQELLKVPAGALVFLGALLDADRAELLDLMKHKGAELKSILEQVNAATFAENQTDPKAKGPRARR